VLRLLTTRNVKLLRNWGCRIFDCVYLSGDNRCDNVLTNQTGDDSLCQWDYNGMGIEYQILAGPSFILAFSIGGLLIGALADRYNRYNDN